MMRPPFQGSAVALVTPFTQDGVDFPALDRLIDFQLANGTDAIVALGTTGEPSTMTDREWEEVVDRCVQRIAGRVPLIAGTGGNDTRKTILKARRAKELQADYQLCVTPYYNKTTQQGLIAHYTAIAEDGALPVIVYNVPGRTGLNMQPETLCALAGHENIAAMKEASGNLSQIVEMVRLCRDKIAFYSGNDDQVAPLMSLGFQGVISVAANLVPGLVHRLAELCLKGDAAGALKMQLRLNPLNAALFSEVSPIPVKGAMEMLGLCPGTLRMPLIPMQPATQVRLERELKALGLMK